MSREMARRGFTLIELLVVMAVIGILLTIATPIFRRALPGAELETSTREIASVLREARSIAIRTNQETGVVFDVEELTLAVSGGALRRLDGQITLALTTAASEQVSERAGGIRFFPDGTSTGGRITISGANRVRFVVVDWLTGNVEIIKREEGREEGRDEGG